MWCNIRVQALSTVNSAMKLSTANSCSCSSFFFELTVQGFHCPSLPLTWKEGDNAVGRVCSFVSLFVCAGDDSRCRQRISMRYSVRIATGTRCARGDTICLRPLQVDNIFAVWFFDLESGVRVTCDVDYLCANFSLPRHPCSRVRPDVRDRQTSGKSIA